jgi:hypothetical protein
MRVDWAAVLDALQLVTRSGDKATAGERAARAYEAHSGLMFLYVASSTAFGFAIGLAFGWAGLRWGWLSLTTQHPWAHRLRVGTHGTLTFAHVLADVSHNGRILLYKGRLRYFALNADGTFSYVVLIATEQRFLRIDGGTPVVGPLRVIGRPSAVAAAATARAAAEEPADGGVPLWVPPEWRAAFPYLVEERKGERTAFGGVASGILARITLLSRLSFFPGMRKDPPGAVLVIAGANIKDIVFQGVYVEGLGAAAARTETVSDVLDRPQKNEEDVRKQIAELQKLKRDPSSGAQTTQADRQTTGTKPSVWEIQTLLEEAGFPPGTIDGRMGPRTRAAIREFQRDEGLAVDGEFGPDTKARLLENIGTTAI